MKWRSITDPPADNGTKILVSPLGDARLANYQGEWIPHSNCDEPIDLRAGYVWQDISLPDFLAYE